MSPITISTIGSAGRNEDAKKVSKERFDLMLEDAKTRINEICKGDTKKVMLVSGGATFADHIAVVLFLTGQYGGLTLYVPQGGCAGGCTPLSPALSSDTKGGSVQSTISFAHQAATKRIKLESDGTGVRAKSKFLTRSDIASKVATGATAASAANDTSKAGAQPSADGLRAIQLHRQFISVLKRDTLAELQLAISRGTKVVERKGFLERNKDVAESDYLIAYTFCGSYLEAVVPRSSGTLNTWRQWDQKHRSNPSHKFHIAIEKLERK